MNLFVKAIIPSVAGTLMMTSFSKLLSLAYDKNYSEPAHLKALIGRLAPVLTKEEAALAGWGAHLAAGYAFCLSYIEACEAGKIKMTARDALLVGLINGALAVLIWKLTYKLHPLPPRLATRAYYLQLVPAHVVFAAFVFLVYRMQQQIRTVGSPAKPPVS